VAGTEEIRFWIMSWGSKAEVIEPESLREAIQAEAETVLEKYSSDAKSNGKPVTA
jgi:predicted DNA-binding transcriptional regulator YafY